MVDTQTSTVDTGSRSPLWQLRSLGQSVWVDYIRRRILENGELERLIRDSAVAGMTSNPAIFEKAIADSDDYDDSLATLAAEGADAGEAYESLVIEDIQRAADIFRGVYDESGGADGFVSLEVSPELANDTEGTIAEARRLWKAVDRPNVMIKVPGTDAGMPAIEQLLFEGINVNITLIFSIAAYDRVIEAFLRGMERRVEAGQPIEHVSSVASFFVSRVDTLVDKKLQARLESTTDAAEKAAIEGLLGKAAVANAKVAYQHYQDAFEGARFARLKEKGASVQRPLWASTSTKNAAYSDVLYVEELIGPDTVNTMPIKTMEAFADHGVVKRTVDQDVETAKAELKALTDHGIDLDEVTSELLAEGVRKFVEPFRELMRVIDEKLTEVASRG